MKAVLISIHPKWCEKIVGGDKTIEVRRTRPKIEKPFKCYIYCCTEKPILIARKNDILGVFEEPKIINGKVIGEFVCDKVYTYNYFTELPNFNSMGLPSGHRSSYLIFEDDYKLMCLSYDEVKNYGNGKPLYGWHISDLKIYDKPKELGEFDYYCKKERPAASEICKGCKYCFKGTTKGNLYCDRTVLTAPQSWCNVEEI